MGARLAQRAARHAALTVALLVVVSVAGAFAARGLSDRLALSEAGPARVAVVTIGEEPAASPTYRAALTAIVAQARADPDVEAVVVRSGAPEPRMATLELFLGDADPAERQLILSRLVEAIDPGPLRVGLAGEETVLAEAREEALSGAGRLMPVAALLAAVAIVVLAGVWQLAAAALAASFAALGTLGILRLASEVLELHLIGVLAGLILGTALGVELTLRILTRHEGEEDRGGRGARRGVAWAGAASVLAAAAAALIPIGYMRTAALAGGLAAALATVGALLAAPAIMRLAGAAPAIRLRGVWAAVADAVAWSSWAALPIALLAGALLAVLATPLLDAPIASFGAAELPATSMARIAADALPAVQPPDLAATLTDRLAVAIGAGTAAAMLLCSLASRSPRFALTLPLALLAPAAACGATALVFGDGSLSEPLDYRPADGVHLAPLAVGGASLAAIAVARWALLAAALRDTAALGAERVPAAAALVGPGSTATAAGLAFAGTALLLSGETFVKELGFLLCAGAVLDLAVARALLAPTAGRLGR